MYQVRGNIFKAQEQTFLKKGISWLRKFIGTGFYVLKISILVFKTLATGLGMSNVHK